MNTTLGLPFARIEELENRIEALKAALWRIDKHLAEFGYGESMKARKMIAAALSET